MAIKINTFFNFNSPKLRRWETKWAEIEGGGENAERRNIERPLFRNFKIANIRIMKDELFDSFVFDFFLFFRNYFNTQNI